MGISPYRTKVLAFTAASIFGGASGFLYLAAVQYTSPETLSFGHSISLVAAMVIGGAGSIIGALIGGAYYVFVPQLTNAIDPNLTTISQGAILLVVLFLLPQGLVSLPGVIRRLFRRRTARSTPPGNHPQNSPVHQPAPDAAREGLEKTERQDRS
jgi:branched-chain amino acid transport system permease protein